MAKWGPRPQSKQKLRGRFGTVPDGLDGLRLLLDRVLIVPETCLMIPEPLLALTHKQPAVHFKPETTETV